jgi:tRNA-Thr(GGU) m(6)t(6)A37 methyltransferase TsaA
MTMPESTSITLAPIGVVRSSHHDPAQTPIQPSFARGCRGRAELLPQYRPGLDGIEGFTHVILLYHLHRSGPVKLIVKPFLKDQLKGVFATRYPDRPNAIGMSILRLVGLQEGALLLEDVDILDGTPLLDIKPYVPRFDRPDGASGGWVDAIEEPSAQQRGHRQSGGGPVTHCSGPLSPGRR